MTRFAVVIALLAALVTTGRSAVNHEPQPSARPVDRAGSPFATVIIDDQQPKFTGEPISLSLKDADLKDVLKTFAELTELNVVIDPSVKGSVTVELRDVPWDQALDLILRVNGLRWVLVNNVLYVAPPSKVISVLATPNR